MKNQATTAALPLKNACLLLLTLLCLTGCAVPEPSFQTKKDPSYNRKLEKVLIVSENEKLALQLGRHSSTRLLAHFAASLAQKNVPSQIVHINEEDLDPSAPVKDAATQFRPEQLIYIGVTHVETQTHSSVIEGRLFDDATPVDATITCRIADRRSGKTVWAGNLQINPPQRPEDIADRLIKQLETEQLL